MKASKNELITLAIKAKMLNDISAYFRLFNNEYEILCSDCKYRNEKDLKAIIKK